MKEEINKYNYLWNGSQPGWVILETQEGHPCVFNEIEGTLLHIEEEHINKKICQHMKDLRIKTIKKVPIVDLKIEPAE